MKIPFKYGERLNSDEVIDREEEIADVMRCLQNGRKLFLIGPRRYGKTAILIEAQERLQRESQAAILRVNAEYFPSLDLLVREIISKTAAQTESGVKKTGDRVKRLFQQLRPEISYNINEQTWTATIGVAAEATEPYQQVKLLTDALDGLEKAAKQSRGTTFGLIIDEFQQVIELGRRQAEGQIRAVIQEHQSVGYVFAGSNTRLLTEMVRDAARPFYRLGDLRFLGPIPRSDFHQFLRTQFEKGGFRIAGTPEGPEGKDDPVTAILDAAEDVPYSIQLLAAECWEEMNIRNRKQLSAEVVRNAIERIAMKFDPLYSQEWTRLTSNQQKTLIAVVREKGARMQSLDVTKVIGKGAGTVRKSLESLMAQKILRPEEKQGKIFFRLEDPFFGHWIRIFING